MPKDTRPPYIPFYVDDFASDGKVEAMTTEEVGAHVLLMCKAWRETPAGSIPTEDRVLARWARMTPDQWADAKAGVLAAWILHEDGRYHQPRMRREYEKLVAHRKSQQRNGKKGATKRWKESSQGVEDKDDKPLLFSDPNSDADGVAITTPMAKDSLSSSSSSSSSNTHTGPPSSAKRFVPPSEEEVRAYCISRSNGIDPKAFIDFYQSNGWRVGRGKMSDWRAAVRTWENRRKEESAAKRKTSTPVPEMAQPPRRDIGRHSI